MENQGLEPKRNTAGMGGRRTWVWEWAAMALLATVTGAAYGPLRHNGFVDRDDDEYVYRNDMTRKGITTESVREALTAVVSCNWHPVTMLSHMLDCHRYGLNPRGHHRTGLILHVLNACLLWRLLRRMTGGFGSCLLMALWFAVHPLRVESVAWLSERKDVLSLFFGLLALHSYLSYAARPGALRYAAVTVFFILGLLSKSMLVTLPALFLLLDYWPLRRFPGGDDGYSPEWTPPVRACNRVSWRRLLAEKIPWFAGAAIVCIITIKTQNPALIDVAPGMRLANAAASYMKYVQKTFYPVDLALLYPYPSFNAPMEVCLAVVMLAAVTAWALYQRRRQPCLVVGWLWFLGTLVPVIGLTQVGYQSMADRYTYLPGIGLNLAVVGTLCNLPALRRYRRVAGWVLGILVTLALSALTWKQVGVWRDSLGLWEHALKATSKNHIAAYNVAEYHREEGRLREAEKWYRQSVVWTPAFSDGRARLIAVLGEQGKHAEALEEGRAALRSGPDNYFVINNLGVIHEQLGRWAEAVSFYQRALNLRPGDSLALNNLGAVFRKQGRWAEALKYYHQSRHANTQPGNPAVEIAAQLEAKQKHLEKLLAKYRTDHPGEPLADGLAHLGEMAMDKGFYEQALYYLRQGLDLQPDHPAGLRKLAWLRAACPEDNYRNASEALLYARRWCGTVQTASADMLDVLAAAYAEAGHFADAVRTARQALQQARIENHPHAGDDFPRRLELYEQGLPYRAPAVK